ncbi:MULTISPECIES: rod-binding protein [unclassified Leisingera]|uniref:rod-binding protein n=1 Tax=unclassified Leisingera TaxID=2614906 RepID=UPI0021A95460|nr:MULTISPECIES: rod-binding protein [unclassified Leisingera]UWQ28644.1 rod-binding protein [Leisingera sp. M523]UWQ74863.1 rod-binding protein [Leisingera sp. M658]
MSDLLPNLLQAAPSTTPVRPAISDPLREAAIELEASFLAEMLKSAGLGEASEGFGGGAGEEQFSSFLIREQATQIARSGGIGLAESLYHALKETQDE